MSSPGVALELLGIEKSFGGVNALSGADLTAARGEIVGLCGENGAGKSTLLKVLSGVHPYGTYRGVVRAFGRELRLASTTEARLAGIAIVHQELMLQPNMTVAECLMLGREPRRFGMIDDAGVEAQARALLGRYGFEGEIDAGAEVSHLGIGLQQIVEIVRALSYETAILVLDEPTAALTARECERLLAWLSGLRAAGTTLLYVSHRLDEVFALCDRVTVLRDGKTALTTPTRDTTPAAVVEAMVGRAVVSARSTLAAPVAGAARPMLELRDLRVGLPDGRFAVDGVSLAVHPGEIVALAGAMGSGRTALLSTLFGAARGTVTGAVSVAGEAVTLTSPADAIAQGIALVPEDRKGQGLVLDMTVAENLALPSLASASVAGEGARAGFVDADAERRHATSRIRELRVRGTESMPVASLSGGNQQKVVLGKWLARGPRVLLLDEPTRGVDVGAREEIYAIVESLAKSGVAVLVASSDLHEVLRLAQRILVLRHGRVAGSLDARTATESDIVSLSTGALS